jgi:hypothetical protein
MCAICCVKQWRRRERVINYLKSIISDVNVALIAEDIKNPVLSKLKVNKEERYAL